MKVLLTVSISLMLLGCTSVPRKRGPRWTFEDYKSFVCTDAPTKDEIRQHFGDPSSTSGAPDYELWRYDLGVDFVTIQFRGEKTIAFTYHENESDIRGTSYRMRTTKVYE